MEVLSRIISHYLIRLLPIDRNFVRIFIPDVYTRSVGINSFMGGGGISLDASWIFHGPHASLLPIITITTTVDGGYTLGLGASSTITEYLGPVEEIDRKIVATHFDPSDPARNLTYAGSISGSAGLAASLGVSYTPPAKEKIYVNLLTKLQLLLV